MIINNDCTGLSQFPTSIGKNFYASGYNGNNASLGNSSIACYNSQGKFIPESLFYYIGIYTSLDTLDMSMSIDSEIIYHVKFTNTGTSSNINVRFNMVFMSIYSLGDTRHALVGCELQSSTNEIYYTEIVNKRSFDRLFKTDTNAIIIKLGWTPPTNTMVTAEMYC